MMLLNKMYIIIKYNGSGDDVRVPSVFDRNVYDRRLGDDHGHLCYSEKSVGHRNSVHAVNRGRFDLVRRIFVRDQPDGPAGEIWSRSRRSIWASPISVFCGYVLSVGMHASFPAGNPPKNHSGAVGSGFFCFPPRRLRPSSGPTTFTTCFWLTAGARGYRDSACDRGILFYLAETYWQMTILFSCVYVLRLSAGRTAASILPGGAASVLRDHSDDRQPVGHI